MIIDEDDFLSHYGTLRRSGRYPWGSGDVGTMRNRDFLSTVQHLKNEGLSDVEVARALNISTTELRAKKTLAKNELKRAQISQAQSLKDKGMSTVAIGERMGLNESSVRALLAPGAREKADALTATSDMLKQQVDEKQFVDIGAGVENYVGVSKERLNNAVAVLKEQGYVVHLVKVPQVSTGHETEMKVLCPPGTTQKEAWENRESIRSIQEFSNDNGHTYTTIRPPLAVDPKRVDVRYAEQGGTQADGVIYVRPGVDDLSLGGKRYAQVRVQVGDDHFLKGMAIYKDDLPDGVDLQFNTNKSDTGNKLDAMKGLKDDPDLPFGSVVRQIVDKPGSPDAKVTSAMNIVNEEGDWDEWSRNLSSQMLSKQSPSLAKEQLGKTYDRKKNDLDEIMELTNPTVKKKLLEEYASSTDAAAVHLKAARMPGQATQVILPVNTMKPTEIYAPNFNNGDRVALIRFPHGGTFEIPELTVNNRQPDAKKILGDAKDAVGIHSSVAERLSGADFDGDTVLVIPNNSGKIKSSPALEGLKDFNPQKYKLPDDAPRMSPKKKQTEMGKVSNLITDMTIKGASTDEIARAVRHSMVVIDAEKHHLDYRQSAKDNGITQLKAQYQGGGTKGASTLISRASSEVRIPDRKLRLQSQGGPINRDTGKLEYVPTKRGRTLPDGTFLPKMIKTEKLAVTDDAHTLSSGTPIEKLYADHSNKLKNLADQARLASINTPPLKYSPSAKKAYAPEVDSLNSKLTLALRNAPRERQAQVVANAAIRARREANPDMDNDMLKKVRSQELERARARMGARKNRIEITEAEWNAIQAGAISDSKLSQILSNADLDVVRTYATPRTVTLMSPAKTARAQALLDSGATRAEVASALGVSLTTLDEATGG